MPQGVLIETLWNVKDNSEQMQCLHGRVLIETLWNVKFLVVGEKELEVNGINRNIVECKA